MKIDDSLQSVIFILNGIILRIFFFHDPIKITYVGELSFTFYFYFLVAKLGTLLYKTIKRAIDRVSRTAC